MIGDLLDRTFSSFLDASWLVVSFSSIASMILGSVLSFLASFSSIALIIFGFQAQTAFRLSSIDTVLPLVDDVEAFRHKKLLLELAHFAFKISMDSLSLK